MLHSKKAFTLAEVMITLTVIGIITAVIIPVAVNSKPDENVMKFKKANETLYNVISTMTNSDKYYLNGDLGTKPDGSDVDATYFCKTFSDIVSVKKSDCRKVEQTSDATKWEHYEHTYWATEWPKHELDRYCKIRQEDNYEEIVTIDGIIIFEPATTVHFKTIGTPYKRRIVEGVYLFYENPDTVNLNRVYKVFCIDVDGLNKGEDPFGYGIRVDGKIITGARADSWLAKSIQGE